MRAAGSSQNETSRGEKTKRPNLIEFSEPLIFPASLKLFCRFSSEGIIIKARQWLNQNPELLDDRLASLRNFVTECQEKIGNPLGKLAAADKNEGQRSVDGLNQIIQDFSPANILSRIPKNSMILVYGFDMTGNVEPLVFHLRDLGFDARTYQSYPKQKTSILKSKDLPRNMTEADSSRMIRACRDPLARLVVDNFIRQDNERDLIPCFFVVKSLSETADGYTNKIEPNRSTVKKEAGTIGSITSSELKMVWKLCYELGVPELEEVARQTFVPISIYTKSETYHHPCTVTTIEESNFQWDESREMRTAWETRNKRHPDGSHSLQPLKDIFQELREQ
jgi:hypothetical protein